MLREQDVYRRSTLERYASLDETNELPGLVPAWERLALAAVGMLLGAGLLWGALGSVPVHVVGEGFLEPVANREAGAGTSSLATRGGGVAVLFLPAVAVDRIRPGMPVRIAPAGERRDVHGALAGRVTDARLSGRGPAPGQVRVRVPSGTSAGGGGPAGSGLLAGRRIPVTGTITIRTERPMALLLRRLRPAERP